ncbi:hypothetical protein SAMN05192529_102177 [Arachidicoccus rhizosphaerae]|uniref:Uncharacterized protein n=1 Tax=Arachidicoccus rhizosphaerae TaxID=551991 RepID=A0A1H3W6J1_9BACT|nr:hypothetical protein SAMN05192529_102177 [Arachidicoccus rhizosphaerae]
MITSTAPDWRQNFVFIDWKKERAMSQLRFEHFNLTASWPYFYWV